MQPAILAKYANQRLPRYTSYPTAPNFSPKVSLETYEAWLANLDADKPVSLYLHVPYCREMCWYCGCHTKITRKETPIDTYTDALVREIGHVANTIKKPVAIQHLHFGGGTPTILGPDRFRLVMDTIHQNFQMSAKAELAIEIDPRTMTVEMAEALGTAGITRASLGVQSFDPFVQRAINRVQSQSETRQTVDWMRKNGVEGINFDLIYGLPLQTTKSCLETIEQAVAMRPDRLSVFGYAHIPGFKVHQKMINEADLPDANARFEQAEAIATALRAAGYLQIGLDHFALPDDELALAANTRTLHRNFQGYTTDNCQTLIGLGASAIGKFEEGFVQNEVAIGKYVNAIRNERLPTIKGYNLTADDKLRADIIERLMCDFEVDISAVCASHNAEPQPLISGNRLLEDLITDQLVIYEAEKLRVNPDIRFAIRTVASAFDAHLGLTGRTYAKAA